MPVACAILLWLLAVALSDDLPLWSYRHDRTGGPRHDGVFVSLTAHRAIEVASVRGCALIDDRRCGYYLLRGRPAVLGTFVGAVPNPTATSTFVVMIPFWLPAAAAGIWPATAWWHRRRPEPRGFPAGPRVTTV